MKPIELFKNIETFIFNVNGRKEIYDLDSYFKQQSNGKMFYLKQLHDLLSLSHIKLIDIQSDLYLHYFYKNVNYWKDFNIKRIEGSYERNFSKEVLERDKRIIENLLKKESMKFEDLIEIQEGGTNFLYDLLINKIINPVFYLNFFERIKPKEKKMYIEELRYTMLITQLIRKQKLWQE